MIEFEAMFKRRLVLYFFTTGLFFLSLFFLVDKNQALAQDSVGLALSPPTFELSANPGDFLKNTIRVENLTDRPMIIVVEKRNFTAMGEEGSVDLTENATPFSLASWITVDPVEVEIGPKGRSIFNFAINVPLNAEPGGHFGSIIFRVGNKEKVVGTGATLSQELGSLILLRIAGKADEEGQFASFKAIKKFFEYGPVDFEIRVRNDGNVHLKPTGSIIINNFWGKKVATIEVEPKNVLPGAIRKLSATWERKFLLGRYRAIVSLNYGTERKILVSSTSFVGFPYKIGGIIILGLLVLTIFIFRARKRLKLALKVLLGRYH